MPDPKDNYRLYMDNAREMLEVAEENFGNERYSTACNRAYYAIFYAASALLYSKGKPTANTARYWLLSVNSLSRQESLIKSGATITNLLWTVVRLLIMTCTTL